MTEVSPSGPHTVTCETGSIEAKHVILATHMPILDRSGHFTIMTPSRTMCIAMTLKEPAKMPKVNNTRKRTERRWHHTREQPRQKSSRFLYSPPSSYCSADELDL